MNKYIVVVAYDYKHIRQLISWYCDLLKGRGVDYKALYTNQTVKTNETTYFFIAKDYNPDRVAGINPTEVIFTLPQKEFVSCNHNLYYRLYERTTRRGDVSNFTEIGMNIMLDEAMYYIFRYKGKWCIRNNCRKGKLITIYEKDVMLSFWFKRSAEKVCKQLNKAVKDGYYIRSMGKYYA